MLTLWMVLTLASAEGDSTIQGPSLRAELGAGIYGGELTFNLGGSSYGTRTFANGKYLLQWKGSLEGTAGLVAYEYPFYPLYGATMAGEAHGVWRFLSEKIFSPCVAVGAGGNAAAIADTAFKSNNLDGLGGVFANNVLRVGGGGAMRLARHTLVLTADVIVEGDSPEPYLAARGFFGGGLFLRYDLADSVAVLAQASYVVTLPAQDAALGLRSQSNRWLLDATVIKKIGAHFFAGFGVNVSREEGDLDYIGTQRFIVDAPVAERVWLSGGYAL